MLKRQDLLSLGGADEFCALFRQFDEVEVQAKPCKDACQKYCRPIARHDLETTPLPPDQEAAEHGHGREEDDLNVEQNPLLERVGRERSNRRVFWCERNEVAFFREPSDRALKEIAVSDEVNEPVAGEGGIADDNDGGTWLAFLGSLLRG